MVSSPLEGRSDSGDGGGGLQAGKGRGDARRHQSAHRARSDGHQTAEHYVCDKDGAIEIVSNRLSSERWVVMMREKVGRKLKVEMPEVAMLVLVPFKKKD